MVEEKRVALENFKGIFKPGFGGNELHLGQTTKEVRAILGKPEHTIRKFKNSYFYVYKNLGLSLDFGKKDGHLRVMFFYRDGCNKYAQAKIITPEGIKPGSTMLDVLNVYGEPDEQYGGKQFSDGYYFRKWLVYFIGIDFQFGLDDKIDIITICKPKRKRHKNIS